MDRQNIFNKVATHLLTQGAKAMVVDSHSGIDRCAYETPTGLRCAIGCLIPEGHKALASRSSVYALVRVHPDLARFWGVSPKSQHDVDFLTGLQCLHDESDPQYWASDLRCFANKYDLDASVVENTQTRCRMDESMPIVDDILEVLGDRGGFSGWWDEIDPDIQQEIRCAMANAIGAHQ